jgi:hypothetical protein
LKITKIDKAKNIVEGEFSFKCYNTETKKVATITEGEFSLFYEEN